MGSMTRKMRSKLKNIISTGAFDVNSNQTAPQFDLTKKIENILSEELELRRKKKNKRKARLRATKKK